MAITGISTRRLSLYLLLVSLFFFSLAGGDASRVNAQDVQQTVTPPAVADPDVEEVNPYFRIERITLPDGTPIEKHIINGPPKPPEAYENLRTESYILAAGDVVLTDFPSYEWVFGCSAVSGAMIAAYYDRNGYPNIYTGPTNSGVMPISDATATSGWDTWVDVSGFTYPNNPLVASHQGLDGLTVRGSIDDYWVEYLSGADDPYIGSWLQHTWGTAIGDFMKTSQSEFGSVDGSTWFYFSATSEPLTCDQMEAHGIDHVDGTYGRKLFYEARGYSVTDCYNQDTDTNDGNFTLADFKTEIDSGHPVLLNLKGHSVVGFGYGSGSTVYVRDTWSSNPNDLISMDWNVGLPDMPLMSVSVVKLASPSPSHNFYMSKDGNGFGLVTSTPAGIDCGIFCYYSFPTGTKVTLTAVPEVGSLFDGWTGDCSGTDSCQVTMDQDKNVIANFTKASGDYEIYFPLIMRRR